jgi:hypothetical protein
LVKHDYDPNLAIVNVFTDYIQHDQVDVVINGNTRFIVGNDISEDGSEMFLTIYSNNIDDVEAYVNEILEEGEILYTVDEGKYKNMYRRVLKSLYADFLLPIIPN